MAEYRIRKGGRYWLIERRYRSHGNYWGGEPVWNWDTVSVCKTWERARDRAFGRSGR